MKYKMASDNNLDYAPCVVDGLKPEPVRYSEPEWLSQYEFYSSLSLGCGPASFSLTENSTGFAIVQCCSGREAAVTEGKMKILSRGRERFEQCVKEKLHK